MPSRHGDAISVDEGLRTEWTMVTRSQNPVTNGMGDGRSARSRALLSMDQAAEDLYREATRRLSRTGLRIDLARAHLLSGDFSSCGCRCRCQRGPVPDIPQGN